jgi:hypothetical protein
MKRRTFLGVLGGAVAWPLAARGQTSAKIPRIGLLWHEASTEEAVIYLGADLSCRQNATHNVVSDARMHLSSPAEEQQAVHRLFDHLQSNLQYIAALALAL